MTRTRDYRSYMRSIGRKPVPSNIRTTRQPGDLEIVYQAGDYRLHRYEEKE